MATFRDVNGGDLGDAARRNDHKLANWVSQNTVPSAGFRNAIINGGFDIWQRGTSITVSNTSAYSADQWIIYGVGTSGSSTFQRGAHGGLGGEWYGGGGKYYAAFTWTLGTDAVNGYHGLTQLIEDVTTLSGRDVTLSFWASGVGNVGVEIQQYFGSGGSPSATIQTQLGLVALTSGPKRYTFTFRMPSVVGKTVGTNGKDCVFVNFWTALGSAYVGRGSGVGWQSGAGKSFNVWDVQLESGNVASPFERRPIGSELALCQRYFERIQSQSATYNIFGTGMCYSATQGAVVIQYQPKRASPTITTSAAGNFVVVNSVGTAITCTSIGPNYSGISSCEFGITVAAGLAAGNATKLHANVTTGAIVDISAEL